MTEQITGPHANLLKEFLTLSTMSLGTVGQEGQPHVAPVYFVADHNIDLYFFSKSSSQHIEDIKQNPSASIAIYPKCFDWQEIRGVQMRGTVDTNIPQEDYDRLINLYAQKFPFVSKFGISLTENRLYLFRPEWVRVVDNRIRFGHKREFTVTSS